MANDYYGESIEDLHAAIDKRYLGKAPYASMPEVLLGENRWTTESPIQQPSNPGAGAMFPLLTYGTGLALGNTYDKGGIADMFTPNVNSVAMEGPMRFAGRGIPKYSNDGIHKDAPDYYPGLPGPELIPMPMPRFPIHPGPDPIWAVPPYSPPAQPDRHPPDSTMIVPEVVYPPEDTRSEWQKWKDSFINDWEAK